MSQEDLLPAVAPLRRQYNVQRLVTDTNTLQHNQPWRRSRTAGQQGLGEEVMLDWKMIVLRAPGGDPSRTDPGGAGLREHADTPLLAKTPYLRKVLASIPAPLYSARLMGLGPGASLGDHQDGKWTFRFGLMRLHVPIITNAGCILTIQGHEHFWDAGQLWYADFDQRHRVRNTGDELRIHLVIDCMPTRELLDLFPAEFCTRFPWSQVLLARDTVPLSPAETTAFQCEFPLPATFLEWSDDPESDPELDLLASVHEHDGGLVLFVGDEPRFGLVHLGEGDFRFAGWTTERTLHIDPNHAATVHFHIREGSFFSEQARPIRQPVSH